MNNRGCTIMPGLVLMSSIASAAETKAPFASIAALEAVKADAPLVSVKALEAVESVCKRISDKLTSVA